MRWIILVGGVTLLSAVIYGCGENPLPAPTPPAAQTVTIIGGAV
jgi:hypothetical protein